MASNNIQAGVHLHGTQKIEVRYWAAADSATHENYGSVNLDGLSLFVTERAQAIALAEALSNLAGRFPVPAPPAGPCATCSHPVQWDTEHYSTPRYVHVLLADVLVCKCGTCAPAGAELPPEAAAELEAPLTVPQALALAEDHPQRASYIPARPARVCCSSDEGFPHAADCAGQE